MSPGSIIQRLFDYRYGASDRLIARWLFLRALGLIYFSAFYSLLFQIRGLIGPEGILPASEYLAAIAQHYGHGALLVCADAAAGFRRSNHMLMAVCWIGLIASVLLFFNLWPRAHACGLLRVLSLVRRRIAGISPATSRTECCWKRVSSRCFLRRPGSGRVGAQAHPPSRASLFLLQWEWFRIYFESGVVKLLSGDPQWRNLTAMDEYYQNGPLPTWIGWYVQHLPHWFHAATVVRDAGDGAGPGLDDVSAAPLCGSICFFIVTPWQIGVILTANYTFLNYLVLALGILLLDDEFLARVLPQRWRRSARSTRRTTVAARHSRSRSGSSRHCRCRRLGRSCTAATAAPIARRIAAHSSWRFAALMLTWIFYATTAETDLDSGCPSLPLPTSPVAALEPFRIANQYGLFAVMTRGRYEIEFQGSNDGRTGPPIRSATSRRISTKAPGIYAPYQPRFDWNLWFASLGNWRENPIVPSTEERLLSGATMCCSCSPPIRSRTRRQSSAGRALAVLVHHTGGKAAHRNVVAPRTARLVCSCLANRPRRQATGGAVAGSVTAPRVDPASISLEASMTSKKKTAPRRKWSAKVHTESTYPPEGLFTKSAAVIARTLASPEVSPKGPGSGMRTLSFYINCAGHNLDAKRLAELEKAKELLHKRVERERDSEKKSMSRKKAA